MKRACGLMALLAGMACVSGLPAQRPVFPAPAAAVPAAPGAGFSFHGRRAGFSVYLGGCAPGWCGPYPYWGRSFSSVTVYYSPPPVVAVPVPAAVALPPGEPVGRDPLIADPLVIRPRAREPRELPAAPPDNPDPPLPGEQAGRFRPIRPEDREQAQKPVQPAAPQPPPPERPKLPPPRDLPPPVRPMLPNADPKVEYARLTTLGRDAFAVQEYGRAARRFRQATEVQPREPLAHFLLAQAEFALGKYREAVAVIHTGMRLQPDWPTARFRPLDLYGPNVADYPDHLAQLSETLARHPEDPVLLFLYAYQLWFDGRRDEAQPLFRRAAALVADPSFIERFLRVLPAEPAI